MVRKEMFGKEKKAKKCQNLHEVQFRFAKGSFSIEEIKKTCSCPLVRYLGHDFGITLQYFGIKIK